MGQDGFSFFWSWSHVVEDKHGFELITLIPMCLRPLVGLRVQLKLKCRLPVASGCIDAFRILSIATCHGQNSLRTVVILKIQ